jgi:glyoxylase-like metal-dependent hydrolase (beta-lactamase superfamily II)
MNRREFIRTSLVISASLAAARRIGAQAPAAVSATQFKPLRGDVGIFTGRGGTIGWLASKDALAVVDTQFPDTALICLKGIPGIGNRTIDATINTHHHMDHTGGNVVFKAASKELVAQVNVPKLQFEAAKRAEQSIKFDGRIDPAATVASQVYAETTFTDVWRRELGSEIVTAEFRGPAHTGGDSVIIFEKANVVHMGDLVFNRIYPFVDRPGGATIRGWVKSLEASAAAYPADAIYVFGHGNPRFGVTGTRGDLLVMRDFFTGVLEHVQREITAGRDKSTVVALENMPEFPDYNAPLPNRLGLILGAAYDELTESKVYPA